MVQAIFTFLKFCYIAQQDIIDTKSLAALEDALSRFYQLQTIFEEHVHTKGFNLPWQHFLEHFAVLIWMFGAPNGLCSSITESKYVNAVKKPWCCLSKFQALGQMLLTNQCIDKLAASCVDFNSHGMLVGMCLSYVLLTLGKFYCLCYIWKWK